jgi:hypothetical protein
MRLKESLQTGVSALLITPLSNSVLSFFMHRARAERQLQHYRTIQSLPIILSEDYKKDAEYLEACRKKRNIVEYDYVGGATEADADELISFVKELREDVLNWLKTNHPSLLPQSHT